MRRVLVGGLVLAWGAVAQTTVPSGGGGPTTVPPSMLRRANVLDTPVSAVRLYAGDLRGNLIRVRLGPGLVLEAAGDEFVLSSTPVPPLPPLQLRQISRVLTADEAGRYEVPIGALIIRNGLVMLEDWDYKRTGASIVPKSVWGKEDTVLVITVELLQTP